MTQEQLLSKFKTPSQDSDVILDSDVCNEVDNRFASPIS